MKKTVAFVLVAMTLLTTALPGSASAYRFFTDEALFLAAAPGARNISFDPIPSGSPPPDMLNQADISVSVMNFPMMMSPSGMSENSLVVTPTHQLVVQSGVWSSPTFINFTPVNSSAFGVKLTNLLPSGDVGFIPPGGLWNRVTPGSTGFFGLLSDDAAPLGLFVLHIAGVLPMDSGAVAFDKVYTQTAATPLPGTLWLLGSSLVGLIGFKKRRTA